MIEFTLPIKTISEANSSEHWTKKHKRHKQQKFIVRSFLNTLKPNITLPCHITLTRIAPRSLDAADNLPASFKWILDTICDYILPGLANGRADSNPDIHVTYSQEKGKPKQYSIKINIVCT